MNYQEIHQYAINTNDPDFIEIIEKVNEVFTNYTVSDWEEEIGNLIVTNSDDSQTNIKDAIISNINAILNFLLRMSHLELIDDILISEKIDILNGLHSIQDYINKDDIINVLQMDSTNEEKISTILQLVTNLQIDRVMSLITNVDDDLIKTIALMLIPDNLDDVKQKTLLLEKQINAYCKFKKIIDNKELFSDQYFINLDVVGIDLNIYLSAYTHQLPKLGNDVLNIEQTVLDLYGLIILSSQFSPVNELVNKNMHLITNDPMISTKIVTEISKLLVKVNNA